MYNLKKCENLPRATAKRLPLYLRYLKMLETSGVTRIKSKEFSELVQIPSATIRRDFSYLGELGRSGYGYDVPYVIDVLNQILDTQQEKRIALVGFGNLGKALYKNNFRRNENLRIVSVFDNDPELVGQEIDGIKIHSIDQFKEIAEENQISVAISTVPSKYSQHAIDEIIKSKVTAILNFAPGRVVVPKGVTVHYIDLTTSLQTLIYFDEKYTNTLSEMTEELEV
ncbi:MAG: redox-sensing transcriptional repressor Rex [Enterococcus sp.]